MAPKTKKKAAVKKAPVKKTVAAKAPAKAAIARPVAAPAAHTHKKGETCCGMGSCCIWTGIIALIIGAAAGYVLSTL